MRRDATRTYDRVQRLSGTDVDSPVVSVIEDPRGSGGNDLTTAGSDRVVDRARVSGATANVTDTVDP